MKRTFIHFEACQTDGAAEEGLRNLRKTRGKLQGKRSIEYIFQVLYAVACLFHPKILVSYLEDYPI